MGREVAAGGGVGWGDFRVSVSEIWYRNTRRWPPIRVPQGLEFGRGPLRDPSQRSRIPFQGSRIQLESPRARSRRSRVRPESPQVRSQGSRVRPESPRVRSQGSRVRPESPQVRSQGSRVRPRESSSSVSRVSNSTREASGSVSRVSDSMSPVLNSIRGPWEETLEAGAETLWGWEGTERGFCGARRCFGGDRRGADRTGEVRRRSPRAPGAPGEVPDSPGDPYPTRSGSRNTRVAVMFPAVRH